MQKYDIINGLAREFGFRRYLEICTPTTGNKYLFVDPTQFDVRHRLMYGCPNDFSDGEDIAFRDPADTSLALIRHLIARIAAQGDREDGRYDIVFVDPRHTYRSSILDLRGALCLLRPNGILVVHDCNPTNPDIVHPTVREGEWCGVTYQAYVDLVLGARWPGWCTVDTDYGCGIIFNAEATVPPAWRDARPDERLILEWTAVRDDDDRRFDFFEQHRDRLLNLVSEEAFLAIHPLARTGPAPGSGSTGGLDLHLLADGRRINPFFAGGGEWGFMIPAGVRSLRMKSRGARPSLVEESSDHRHLGLCLRSLTARVGQEDVVLPLDHPWLKQGLHGVEWLDGRMWRWTDGDTPLPMALLGQGMVPVTLTVRGHHLPRLRG